MSQVKSGDTVRIHYTGTLADGVQFDSSAGREPLEFKIGGGQVIPGLEREMIGMASGEKKLIQIAADDAYGPHRPEGVQQVPRGDLPESIELAVGLELTASSPDGQSMRVMVTALDDEFVTMDANHPLAGKDLTFDVELLEITA